MPHVTVLYTPNLDAPDAHADIGGLVRRLADAMLAVRDEAGREVFPPGGVRVFALRAEHAAVADGTRDYAFVYVHLRMARGRSDAAQQRAGEALSQAARSHFAPLFDAGRHLGLTVQVDEGPEVFDAKHSTIHPLFARP